MKKLYLFAATAAMLASCSSNDLTETRNVAQNQDTDAVTFGAYVGRGTVRAGAAGVLTTSTGAKNLQTEGFGVFGYYTDNVPYNETAQPDFFYNQKVSGPAWTYSPIKYWPNEFGTDAESAGQDKLTFFAYAPYVEVTPGTGRIPSTASTEEDTYGIIGMTSNIAKGDPYVKYLVSFDPEKSVDLCYGVANAAFTSSVDGTNNSVEAGKPYIDVIKPKIADKIAFNFKHALAQLNVQIDADIDELSHGTVNYLDGSTKIYVRKVSFEGFAQKGQLNLNSEVDAPNWYELSSANTRLSSGSVTVYDGRRDGKEGQANATASNETPNALNPSIIQTDAATSGVPATTQVNLFDGETAEAPIFVIPTDDDLKVTIVYDVETADPNLATYLSDGKTTGSTVENTITKTIEIGSTPIKLAAGKSYKVTLHLGMTSVKFDATVTQWVEETPDNVDLPINSDGTFAAGRAGSLTLNADAVTGGTLTVSGLTNGDSYTITADGTVVTSTTPASGSISGTTQVITYNVAANNTFSKKEGWIKLTTGTSPNQVETTINITQQAQALGLSATAIDGSAKTITLASTGAFSANDDWKDDSKVTWTVVKKAANGTTTLLEKAASAAAGKYAVAGTSTTAATITLNDAFAAGDEYIITAKAGDAAAETITVKIGGVAFAAAAQSKEAAVSSKIAPQTPIIYGGGIIGTTGWSSSATDKATINAATGEITVVDAGDTDISVTLTEPGAPDGYFYTTDSKTAKYTLTITAPAP